MNTLNSDKSLRPYIDQFVPLKISAQSDDYKRWKQFFPPKKSAIPALFIVTPQGKELYSAVGALPTKSLQKVMLTSLEKAERYPTKSQWKELATTLDESQKALAEHDIETAVKLLKPVLGKLEQMGSLLDLADDGRAAAAKINEIADTERELLEDALKSLVSKSDFQSAMEVAGLEELLLAKPQQRKLTAVAIKKTVRDAESRSLLRQARDLVQAMSLTDQTESKLKRKGVAALKRIAKKYPDTDAAAQAEQRLASLAN